MPDTSSNSEKSSETPWSKGNLGRGRHPRILFGVSYEDERIELEEFGNPDRICVIAASGETAAACAAAGHEVTAVDINPVQLDYAQARLASGRSRLGTAEQGMRVARSALGPIVPGWRWSRLGPVLAEADGEQAVDYWRRALNTGAFRRLLALGLRPTSLIVRTLQPEFARFLPRQFDQIILQRMEQGLARHGMAQNRYAWRMLAGREMPGWTLPLEHENPDAGGSVSWLQADVLDHLESVPAGHYGGVSLSNVLDGASFAYGRRLRQAASRAVRPGGAVVLRSFAPPGSAGPGRAADDAAMLWGSISTTR